MQALVKARPERGALEHREVPKPEPGPEEALIEVAHAGLCGSDAGIYQYEPSYEVMDLPTVIGHEYAGRVVDVGDRVATVEPGDRIVDRILRSCGTCHQCRTGSPNVCADASIFGVHEDGAYAEFVTAPAESLHVVPDDLGLREAALTEPVAVAERAVAHNSRVEAGDRVLVEGPGPIGLLIAQLADASGAEVTVSGVGADASYRLPLARDLGFETVNVESESLDDAGAAATDGVGFDVVFDATGHPSGVPTAASAVRKGGQVVIVGIAGETEVDLTPLVRGEVDLQCSYCYTWIEFERALRALSTGDVDTDRFVDTRFSIADPDAAFETFLDGETCKVVFDVTEL